MGYSRFKLILDSIEEEAVWLIYTATKDIMSVYISKMLCDQRTLCSPDLRPQEQQLLLKAVQVHMKVYTFPFMMTMMEFNSEARLDEIGPIVLPDNFNEKYLDFDFFQRLCSFVLHYSVDEELRFEVVKVLSRMPSVRKNISRDPRQADEFIKFLLLAFQSITNSKFETLGTQVLEELLDFGQRLFRVYKIGELARFEQNFPPFVRQLAGMAELVFKTDYCVRHSSSRSATTDRAS
jgi:hypothetical protein